MRTTFARPPLGPLARRPSGSLLRPVIRPTIYRLGMEGGNEARPAGPLARDEALARVEAALFAADEPLTPRRLATAAGLPDIAEARRQVRRLQGLFEKDGSAFQVEEIAGGFQLLSRPEFHPWLVRLKRTGHE